jgi:hypothetical protein
MVVQIRPVPKMRDPLPEYSVQEMLFDPLYLPVQGIVSSMSGMSLNPGEWSQLGGWRLDKRSMRVRDAHIRWDGGGLPNDGSFRGEHTGKFVAGTAADFAVVALRRSGTSKVHIYATNTGTFAEQTASSGAYGDTRLSDSTNPVHMCVVQDKRDGANFLVIQNGVDYPLVYDGAGNIAFHRPIEFPSGGHDLKTVPTMAGYFLVSTTTRPTYTNLTAGKFSLSDTGTSPNYSILVTVDSTWTTSADTGKALFATPVDLSQSPQLVFAVETDVLNFMDSLKIEVSEDDATYYTVWDPTDAKYKRTRAIEYDANTSRELFGFNIDAIRTNLTAVDWIRFSWVGTAPAADITMKIHMIAASGAVRGKARHKISYQNSVSRAESIGQLITTVEPARIKDLGGPDMDGSRLPNSDEIFYNYKLYYQNTGTGDRDLGVNMLNVYRKDYGEARYAWVGDETIASWGGASWAFTTGNALEVQTFTDDLPASGKDWRNEAPPAEHIPIPKGTGMIFSNGRFFVGSVDNPGVYFSRRYRPFRFLHVHPAGDPDAGSSFLTPGDNVVAFAAVATSVVGSNTIYTFTESKVLEANGISTNSLMRMALVDDNGTKSPFSVAVGHGSVYYADTNLQIRRIGATIDDLSRLTVDDKLKAIPASRRAWVSGAYHDERYHLAYTPAAGSQNTRVLIFNAVLDMIESDDPVPSPFTVDGFGRLFDNTLKRFRLLGYSSDFKVYEYTQPAATLDFATTKPAVEWTTREIHYPFAQCFHITDVGIHMDADAGSTLSLTKTYNRMGGSVPSTIALTPPTGKSQVYALDRPTAATGTPHGPSCQISCTGSVTGGKHVYGLVYNVAAVSGGGRDG